MAIEKLNYSVIQSESPYELRYIEHAAVIKHNDTTLSGGSGFSKLFNYIQGNNVEQKKISMTAPVIQHQKEELTVAFVVPSTLLDSIPKPVNQDIRIETIRNKRFVSMSFRGSNYEKKIKIVEHSLREWAQSKGIELEDTVHLARYNPPIVPGFLRKNECWIFVK